MRIHTGVAPARERFDYWRSLFPSVDMRPARRTDARPYDSENLNCVGDDGAVFASIRSDATDTRFLDGEENHVMLNFITHGKISVRHGRGRMDVIDSSSGLILHDCARPSHTVSAIGHRGLHLSIPRFRAMQILGEAPSGHEGALRTLAETPLNALLRNHLSVMARHGETLSPDAAALMLDAASSLALACLEQIANADPDTDRPDHHLFVAARRYIESRAVDPALSASDVARALGCSRARLYRIFARRNLTVSAHIWDVRLIRSRELLRDSRLTISDVAAACGYGDPPAFSKAFRRRFGMTPRDWRAESL